MQHPDKTLATYVYSHCNILKHLENTLATYMYCHYNICNIQIYFCNICMKHLKQTDEITKKR